MFQTALAHSSSRAKLEEYAWPAFKTLRLTLPIDGGKNLHRQMHADAALGFIGGAITTGASIPQLIKIAKTKRTEDLSWGMITMWIVGLTMTSGYGIAVSQPPIYTTSIMSLFMTLIMASMKWRFDTLNPDEERIALF